MYSSKAKLQIYSVFILLATIAQTELTFAKTISVMQYNVENLFTVHEEGAKPDDEFAPPHWTKEFLKEKLEHLGEVIRSVKNADGSLCPDVLALAEVENSAALKKLRDGPLKECGYIESVIDPRDPDPRGIRTALLSKIPLAPKPMKPVHHKTYAVGRFILEIPLMLNNHVLIVFTNHWKSRSTRPPDTDGGAAKRQLASDVLKHRVEEILSDHPDMDIIAMGDFNDEPEDKSIRSLGITANPQQLVDEVPGKIFWESSYELLTRAYMDDIPAEQKGKAFRIARHTYYYAEDKVYNQLDHILLSKGLFDEEGFRYHPQSFRIVRFPKYVNKTTHGPIGYRLKVEDDGSVSGPRGASDHYPVMLSLDVD